jgi:putative transcriptional regulator
MTKSPSQFWSLRGHQIKEPIQYKGCGLDNIWLSSGYELEDIDGEKSIIVRNLDGLHAAIGRSLIKRKKILDGKEIRFLRQQMDLTQSETARLVGCDAQQIARYEKNENKMPGPTDRLIRMLFSEHLNDHGSTRSMLEALDQLDGRMDDRQVFDETPEGWKIAA